MKNAIIITTLVLVCHMATCMVQPPKPSSKRASFPPDMKRYLIPFIASVKVHEVIDAIRALNATDKCFHAAVQSEEIMLKLLKRMPYTINAVDLIRRLHKMPVMKSKSIDQWRNATELTDGDRLFFMINFGDSLKVSELLRNKNIHLTWAVFSKNYEAPLERAIGNGNFTIVKMLLESGADPNFDSSGFPSYLSMAAQKCDIEIVKILLAYGANPNISMWAGHQIGSVEIRKLIKKAHEERKKRLLQLLGNKSHKKTQ